MLDTVSKCWGIKLSVKHLRHKGLCHQPWSRAGWLSWGRGTFRQLLPRCPSRRSRRVACSARGRPWQQIPQCHKRSALLMGNLSYGNNVHHKLLPGESIPSADNRPALTFLPWGPAGRCSSRRHPLPGAARAWSPLLWEACPRLKVGFGARALDGDRKRRGLRQLCRDVPVQTDLEIVEFSPC